MPAQEKALRRKGRLRTTIAVTMTGPDGKPVTSSRKAALKVKH